MTLAGTKMGSGVFDSVTKDGVTTFGTGVDPTVGSLGYTYDDAGLLASATSYGTVVGAGPAPVLNQDADAYDGFGQLAAEEQAVAGPASPDSPTVGYTYDAGNGDRPTGIVYPDGRTVGYNYGVPGSLTNAASQVTSLSDATGPIQSYGYLGLDTPVTFADGNGITLSYVGAGGTAGDAGDTVTGLDRFGRVADQKWTNSSGTTVDGEQYAYDADSDVLARRNEALPGQSESYTYDGLNRLATFTRGTLPGGATAIGGTATESWGLDALGNWNSDTVSGSTTTRTNSAQNQVKTVTTPAAGGADATATLGYDKDGNTLKDATGQHYVYDAWNRLVQVSDAARNPLAIYGYDAQGRRVTELRATGLTDLYYSDRWQVLDEQGPVWSPSDVGPEYQYVWSPFDVDRLVERDTVASQAEGQPDPAFGDGGAVAQADGGYYEVPLSPPDGDPLVDGGVAVTHGGLPSEAAVVVAATDQVTGELVLFGYTASGAVDSADSATAGG